MVLPVGAAVDEAVEGGLPLEARHARRWERRSGKGGEVPAGPSYSAENERSRGQAQRANRCLRWGSSCMDHGVSDLQCNVRDFAQACLYHTRPFVAARCDPPHRYKYMSMSSLANAREVSLAVTPSLLLRNETSLRFSQLWRRGPTRARHPCLPPVTIDVGSRRGQARLAGPLMGFLGRLASGAVTKDRDALSVTITLAFRATMVFANYMQGFWPYLPQSAFHSPPPPMEPIR